MTVKPKIGPRQGSAVVWPSGLEERYDISPQSRWRWEKKKKLPPRDVFINGEAVGWKPATLDAADRGEYTAPSLIDGKRKRRARTEGAP